jgi:hypothetical protein
MAPDVTPTGSLVYGHNKGSVVLFAYVLPNGRVYVSDELRARQLPIEEIALRTLRKFEELGWQRVPLACPDDLAPSDDETPAAEAPMQTFGRHGVHLWPVDIGNKDHGWARTHEFLRLAPDGKPWLVVSPRCKQLIRTMPSLVEDPNNADDIDNGQEDRAALALRTLLASRPAPGSVRQSATPPAYMTLGWVKACDRRVAQPTGLLARR